MSAEASGKARRARARPASGRPDVIEPERGFRLRGPASRVAERLVSRVVVRNMAATLLAVRRLVEFERPAAARR